MCIRDRGRDTRIDSPASAMDGAVRIDAAKPVLNREIGLANMGGNKEIYRQVMDVYEKENQDTIARLSAAIRDRRYEDATQIVHKVKGSSGSIGANPLNSISTQLQQALQDKDETVIPALAQQFIQTMQTLLQEIADMRE